MESDSLSSRINAKTIKAETKVQTGANNYNTSLGGTVNQDLNQEFNPQGLEYLNYLQEKNNSQLSSNNVLFNPMAEIHKDWDETTRGLTEASQIVVAAAAVAIAIGTGGIGSGISGAMMTAGATVAGTTATVSATNASMNADGNMLGSLDDVGKTTLKDTTSKESLKNIAVSVAVVGAATWAVTAANGSPNLKTGSYEGSKVGVNVEQSTSNGKWYIEGKTPELLGRNAEPASWFDTYVVGNQNPGFKTLNATTPSVSSGAAGHDVWVDNMQFGGGMTAVTAAPYLVINTCAAAPSLCGIYINTKTDKDFLNQKPAN